MIIYSEPIVKHMRMTSYPCVSRPPFAQTLYTFHRQLVQGCGRENRLRLAFGMLTPNVDVADCSA